MKAYIFDGTWKEYNRSLLERDRAYKFVAWVNGDGNDVVLVVPVEYRGLNVYHKNAVTLAVQEELIEDSIGDPNAYGAIRRLFEGQSDVDRIVLWTSQSYGRTDDRLRPAVREALDLGDVVY